METVNTQTQANQVIYGTQTEVEKAETAFNVMLDREQEGFYRHFLSRLGTKREREMARQILQNYTFFSWCGIRNRMRKLYMHYVPAHEILTYIETTREEERKKHVESR